MLKHSWRWILGLIVFSVFLSGCGGGSNEALVQTAAIYPAADYMPLAVNKWWKYHEVYYDLGSASALHTQASYTTSVAIERILSREFLEGVWWYKMRRRWIGSSQDRITYWRHNSEGLLWSMDPSGLRSYLIKAPVQVGHTWAVTGGHCRIVNLSGNVTVPYGQVNQCLVVEETSTTNPAIRVKYWFAPNLGLVRELHFDGPDLLARYDLSKTGTLIP